MLLWVPRALLALLLPMLLAQGEGKGTMRKHAGLGGPSQRWGRRHLIPPRVEGRGIYGVGAAAGKSGVSHRGARENFKALWSS